MAAECPTVVAESPTHTSHSQSYLGRLFHGRWCLLGSWWARVPLLLPQLVGVQTQTGQVPTKSPAGTGNGVLKEHGKLLPYLPFAPNITSAPYPLSFIFLNFPQLPNPGKQSSPLTTSILHKPESQPCNSPHFSPCTTTLGSPLQTCLRDRSLSPPSIHPRRADMLVEPVDHLQTFANDLQTSVRALLPTGGRHYQRAAILAITFSRSDIPSVVPLRDELLDLLAKAYNWEVERHMVDCNMHYFTALQEVQFAILNFTKKFASDQSSQGSLICIYYSGHGFWGKDKKLAICGSMNESGPRKPYIPWDQLKSFSSTILLTEKDHRLAILDCCAAGLAFLDRDDIEVLGASAWESTAAVPAQASFTRAIIDELRALQGAAITTTQLISRLHSLQSVRNGRSMPVHKRAMTNDQPPALIHRIEQTPALSSAQVVGVPKYSHVLIAVKVS